MLIEGAARDFIANHRVARLATADGAGQPTIVPTCYAFDGQLIYSPVDAKPKRVPAAALKRIRNIRENPRVALLIDDYSEDWSELAYVLIIGAAELVESDQERERAIELLRQKYSQYRRVAINAIIKITPIRVKVWSWSG